MKISLKVKMILAFTGVALAAITGIVLYASFDSSRQLNNYLVRGSQAGLSALVSDLENYYRNTGSWNGVDTVFSTVQQGHGTGNQNSIYNRLTLIGADRAVVWSASIDFQTGEIVKKSDLTRALKIEDGGGNVVGYLLADSAASNLASDLRPFVQRLREAMIWSGILAALAAAGLAILVSNYLLWPVKELTRASERLSSGELSTRVQVNGSDELAVLGRTFNQMAQSLASAEERKKALTADVAHELRTPLAVQKAQIEAMLDGVIQTDQKNLRIVADQTEFLSHMVDDLRTLAMADAGELKLEIRPVNPTDIITRVVEQFTPQANLTDSKIITRISDADRSIVVNTDRDRFQQVLQNLLSNALRYGKKAGKIEISLITNPNNLVIAVHDDGPGIPAEAIPHLFERFYRHEKARSRESGGTGLGLAISKKLAQIIGGDLSAENHPQGGAVFTLKIPM